MPLLAYTSSSPLEPPHWFGLVFDLMLPSPALSVLDERRLLAHIGATFKLSSNQANQFLTQLLANICVTAYAQSHNTNTQFTQLYLSYYISVKNNTPINAMHLAPLINWQPYDKTHDFFADYLWQATCLECFIAGDDTKYVEINASPNGAYALYDFADYRTPSSMPPPRLYQNQPNIARINHLKSTNNQHGIKGSDTALAKIHWHTHAPDAIKTVANRVTRSVDDNLLTGMTEDVLQRHFSIYLSQLPSFFSNTLSGNALSGNTAFGNDASLKHDADVSGSDVSGSDVNVSNISNTNINGTHTTSTINTNKERLSLTPVFNRLHPCVILNIAGVPLYFTTAHATPPDFHNRQYWTHLGYL